MDTISKWLIAIIASIIASGVVGLWRMSEEVSNINSRVSIIETRGSSQVQDLSNRLTRVEEIQRSMGDRTNEILQELKRHEQETKSK